MDGGQDGEREILVVLQRLVQLAEISCDLQREQNSMIRYRGGMSGVSEVDLRSEYTTLTRKFSPIPKTRRLPPETGSLASSCRPPQQSWELKTQNSDTKSRSPLPSFEHLRAVASDTRKPGVLDDCVQGVRSGLADIVWDLQGVAPSLGHGSSADGSQASRMNIDWEMASNGRSTRGLSNMTLQKPPPKYLKTLTLDSFGPSTSAQELVEPPQDLPPVLARALFICGMWTADICPIRYRRMYRIYRVSLALLMLSAFFANTLAAALALTVDSEKMTGALYSHCYASVLGAALALVFLWIWLALVREFRPGGLAMGLLHDVVFRSSDLTSCKRSCHNYISAVMLSILARSCLEVFSATAETQDCAKVMTNPVGVDICTFALTSSFLTSMTVIGEVWMILWVVQMLCSLHMVELRWFADTVAATLQTAAAHNEELLQELDQVEARITRRFIHASQRWVLSVVVGSSLLGLLLVLIVTLVMTNGYHFDLVDVLELVANILILTVAVFSSFIPFARVAEVHEYDLLRTLNKPQVLHRAMPLLGQQMLPHLHTLEWGFKIGQTIINMRLIMNVLGAVAVTCITTLGATAMTSMSAGSN